MGVGEGSAVGFGLGVDVGASWVGVGRACIVPATAACTLASKSGVATGVAVGTVAGISPAQATAMSSSRIGANLGMSVLAVIRSRYYTFDREGFILEATVSRFLLLRFEVLAFHGFTGAQGPAAARAVVPAIIATPVMHAIAVMWS